MSMKPMNCPGHFLTYASQVHSYRDLPVRFHEQTPLHRNEASGVLSGLTRVRQFSQDDANCFITPDQIGDEVERLIRLVQRATETSACRTPPSCRPVPDEHMGEIATWEHAEAQLKAALERPASPTSSTRRTARSTGRRSIRRDRRDRPQVAVRHDPARLHAAGEFDLKYIGADKPSTGRSSSTGPFSAASSGSSRSSSSTTPGPFRSGWPRFRRSCCRSPTVT